MRGVMVREQSGQLNGSIFNIPYESEVIIKMTGYKSARQLDYPCGCRHCQDLKAASRGMVSSIANIDVFDMPDDIDVESADYFH